MLAVRKPPSPFVVTSAMGVGDVPVVVDRREFHVVLVIQSVAGVAVILVYHQLEAVGVVEHPDVVVVGLPVFPVDVLHVNLQTGTVVLSQVMDVPVAQPMFTGCRAEAIGVVIPVLVEVDRTVVTLLDEGPAVHAVGKNGFSIAWTDKIDTVGT